MPVWHASVSLQSDNRWVLNNRYVERKAINALRGVGGDFEWWVAPRHVGHLRVPVTPEEYELIPPGCAIHDAGETGPKRPRSK